jgi:hypothetical protein
MIFDRFIPKKFNHVASEICYFYPFILFVNYGEDCSSADHVHDAGFDSCVVSQGTKTPAKLDARHLCFG